MLDEFHQVKQLVLKEGFCRRGVLHEKAEVGGLTNEENYKNPDIVHGLKNLYTESTTHVYPS